jgi:hypothetical protein
MAEARIPFCKTFYANDEIHNSIIIQAFNRNRIPSLLLNHDNGGGKSVVTLAVLLIFGVL